MKRLALSAVLCLVASLLVLPSIPAAADAAGCPLGSYDGIDDECEISGANTATGTHNFHHSVRMLAGSSINASGSGITLNVNGAAGLDFIMDPTDSLIEANDDIFPPNASASPITINVSGDMTMGAGSRVLTENNNAGGNGGNITIDVDGDMTMAGTSGPTPGALISSRKTGGAGDTGVAGNITITVGDTDAATGTFFMGGGSPTYGSETGAKVLATGRGPSGDISITAGKTFETEPGSVIESGGPNPTAIQQGGKVFLVSGCALTSRGRVTSKGPDPAGDLVHIEACDVLITGLVESTGKGHTSNAKNSCDNVNDGLLGEVFRPGKPANATGCIEVWANNITIDSTGFNAGELNADIGNGGPQGESWIDLFALSSLVINDGAGNNRNSSNGGGTYFNTYAVHAKGIAGSDATPNDIVAKVSQGPMDTLGDVFQAGTDANGSNGGTILLESDADMNLDTSKIAASGHGAGDGGSIVAKSFDGDLSWQNGDGDVDGSPNGTILLEACGTATTTGTNFHAVTPTTNDGDCGDGDPTFPAYVGDFFNLANWENCEETARKSGIKWDDLNGDGVRDAGEPLLPGWVIHLFNADESVHLEDTTDANGFYEFTVPPGTYTVCEELQPGWTQTYPDPGTDGTTCEGHTHGATLTMGAAGYTFTLAADDNHVNNDFGNDPQPDNFCEKQAVNDVLDPITGRFPDNLGPDVVVDTGDGDLVQDAVDSATDVNGDGYLIIGVAKDTSGTLGGHSTQSVVIDDVYTETFALIGCSVTLHDPTPGDSNPVIRIAATAGSPGNIFLMDLHAADSAAAGIVVEGNGRYLRNEDALDNGTGFRILGDDNTMHNGSAESNTGVGVSVGGNDNLLTDADAFSNGGHGFQVVGNGNRLLKLDSGDRGKGNGGDGVNLNGWGNLLSENDAYANAGDGFEVTGGTASDPNVLEKNRAGDASKGNGGQGFSIGGSGNGTPDPVELEENSAEANTLNGFLVTGTGHELEKNESEDNGDCEFLVVAGNFNAENNEANGATVLPNTDGAAFPTACLGTA